MIAPKPTSKQIVTLLLAVEFAALAAVVLYWVYLRLELSHSLGLAARILSALGCAAIVGLAAWAAWRIGRRNHFRFSIRSMMIAIAVVALLLGILLPRLQQNMELQKRIAAYTLAQSVISSHNGLQSISFPRGSDGLHRHWTVEELATPQEDAYHQVIFTNQQLTDHELELLAGHPNLYSIAFRNCQFSELGFLELAKLKTLKGLDLRNQNVDDVSVNEFQRLRPDCQIDR